MTRVQHGKVYEGVLHQLRTYIEEHKLGPGDKLPSERELSEQLHVGRSSIREAFRAMELLGLIETRRGEGTFMRAYRPYHMVELLSNFLLNETRTKDELVTAKQMLEKEVLCLVKDRLTHIHYAEMEEILNIQSLETRHQALFLYLFERCEHPLLLSMWQFISGFTRTVHDLHFKEDWYLALLKALRSKDTLEILKLFR
ncbi:GntR family transcriptional regulator [Halobacillus sp. ACCC02827]|uniref:FadR/GntR family transcriptional regulator n=1 Tax=Bacillaceae TaxID=186817 RepID=UPI0002A51F21|nr:MULTISPECIES: GntR family transcriptional regulator [Bacillaceae]ELK47289.1 GntR family transcriptional regulator [Halobacillus sp. BAB-2008]QHT47404.1 FadR family transcriptional regulator [Bacillus sp. SB49]WJE14627.1 GntR family transcriptional regulator [Halobacillus sp. ACCC02827]